MRCLKYYRGKIPLSLLALWLQLVCLIGARPGLGVAAEHEALALEAKPSLVVFIVVDQLGSQTFERYEPFFQRGFRTLIDSAVQFRRADLGIAVTATCPGHAVLITGTYPRDSGIVANYWYDGDRREKVYCIADSRFEFSPRNLRTDTLGDFFKKTSEGSRVFSVAGKDRTAVILGGRRADLALWYDRDTGRFRSSGYYRGPGRSLWEESLGPSALQYFGSGWYPLEASHRIAEQLPFTLIAHPLHQFPYSLGGTTLAPSGSFFSAIYRSPFLDDLTLEAAEILLEKGRLGQRQHGVDLLTIGLSAVDTIGHEFGPESLETVDALVRLDHRLGNFFDKLFSLLPREQVLIVLSADHGVQRLPEQSSLVRRISTPEVLCLQNAVRVSSEKLGVEELFSFGNHLNLRELRRRKIAAKRASEMVATSLRACPAVREVITATQLVAPEGDGIGDALTTEGKDPQTDSELELFRRNFFRGRSPEIAILFEEGVLVNQVSGTTHGTPYEHDRIVPVLIAHPQLAPQVHQEEVMAVELKQTLIQLLGLDLRQAPAVERSRSMTDVLTELLSPPQEPASRVDE